jgi:hypothetical protein
MNPKFRISLHPSDGGNLVAKARISLELDIVIHPNVRDLVERVKHEELREVINPFTAEKIPVHIDEIGDKLIAALDLIQHLNGLPPDSSLVTDEGTFFKTISLSDLQLLDARLSKACCVEVEGTALPKAIVFTSGLSTWRLPFASLPELEAIRDDLKARTIAIKDPNSPDYIPIEKEREFNGIMLDQGLNKAEKEVQALKDFLDRDGKVDAKKNYETYLHDTQDAREPSFRDGDSGGFRGNGGFYK